MTKLYNCEKACQICDKSQYKETGFAEKLLLQFHLAFCFLCRKYTANNKKLTRAMKNSDLKTLTVAQKQILQQRLQMELRKQD